VDGERQREAILAALREARDGLDTNQLAALLDLHPNTIRWHLGLLTDARLVQATPERRRARGRPSVVHRLTGEGVVRGRDEYRLLATMLTDVVAADRDGTRRAYDAGLRWGRHLQKADPEANLAELLDRQGFDAKAHGDELEMRRCPFCALAESSPQVVCTLHRGILDGVLAGSGSRRAVERLDPFVEPGLCVAHLSGGG
jgi:predicted ArsR family transcriptional regulator